MSAPVISVVIATRNRGASLRRLLPALLEQQPGEPWEVVVADNGSSDDTAAVLAGFAPRVVAVSEPRAGKCRALNRALQAARGDLVVFTDDDVEPAPDWLAELAAAARRHPDADGFGGRIVVDEREVPQWILRSRVRQLLTSAHDYGDSEGPYPPNRYPIGPNMAVRRRALRIADPFPVELGPGSAIPVGDETAFFYRLAIRPVYVPRAKVRHQPAPGYFVLRAALRRCWLAGYSAGMTSARYAAQAAPEVQRTDFLAKVASTRSLREFMCSTVRLAGYAVGYARG